MKGSATVSKILATIAAASLVTTLGVVTTVAPAGAQSSDDSTTTTTTTTPSEQPLGASVSCANSSTLGATSGATAGATSDTTSDTTAGATASLDATSLAKTLLEGVAKGAGSKTGEFFAGWALSSIFGPSEGNNEETLVLLHDLSTQITQLNKQVDQLSDQLATAVQQIKSEVDRSTYELEAATLRDDISKLSDYQAKLASWLKRPPGASVDGSDSNDLLTMRTNLGVIINHLNTTMMGQTGSQGLIAIYAKVVRDDLAAKGAPSSPRFVTADFTTPVSDQLDYYEGLMVQAFEMLAEVYHVTWKIGDVSYGDNIPYVQSYANCVPQFLAAWDLKATDGLGKLPATVVADVQNKLMWTRSGLSVSGDGYPFADQFCWAACGVLLPARELSTWMTPTRSILGYTGWRVPSTAEFSALVSGHANGAIAYLKTVGFDWRDNTTINIDGYPVSVPPYWLAGGTAASFDPSFHAVQWLSTALPGPGAVAVRSFG